MIALTIQVIGGGGTRWNKVSPAIKKTESWIELSSFGIPRYGADIFIYNNKLYIVGGMTNSGVTSTVEYMDLSTLYRDYAEYMPNPRAFFAGTFYNDKFYIFGGIDNGGVPRKDIYIYDPSTNTWTTSGASLPVGIAYLKSVALNDKIYVIGGMNENGDIVGTVYEYDPATDTLVEKSGTMITPRENFAVAVLNGKIYVFGGDNGTSLISSVEQYNPSNDSWISSGEMPEQLTGIDAVTVSTDNGEYIIILGG